LIEKPQSILGGEGKMSGKFGFIRNGALALMGLLLLAIAQTAAAQEATPQETKGVSVDSIDLLALAPQVPELKGYALRIRKIILEPGAVIAHHNHANRPIAVYVVSGEFTEVRDDTPEITRRPGDQWTEGADVAHWGANRGQVPNVLIAVDVVPEE
jgi:quercetin dioxygenase-like cupin family protein